MKLPLLLIIGILVSIVPIVAVGQSGGAIETIVGDQKVEETFHENGHKKSEARKKMDKSGNWVTDGVVRTWYPSGAKRGVLVYEMGVPAGVWKSFYEDGKQYDERVYKNGTPTGTWKRYYKNGQLMDESTFTAIADSITEVHMRVFHENGKLSQQGKWRREAFQGKEPTNVKDGKWVYFDDHGTLVRTESYVDGKLQK